MAKQPVQYVTADIILENGLTLSQELFAMAYIELGDASQAFEKVRGYPPSPKELKALCDLPAMARRVSALYNQRVAVMQQSCRVDVDLLVRELEQARQIAISEREASAAIAATMGKAKLHGLLIDRKEISLKRPEDMTEAELRQVLGIEVTEAVEMRETAGGWQAVPSGEAGEPEAENAGDGVGGEMAASVGEDA